TSKSKYAPQLRDFSNAIQGKTRSHYQRCLRFIPITSHAGIFAFELPMAIHSSCRTSANRTFSSCELPILVPTSICAIRAKLCISHQT
ncbi:hypothetical protein PMAYCL1PPCAC_16048, partial [Pristionchus mayeri]